MDEELLGPRLAEVVPEEGVVQGVVLAGPGVQRVVQVEVVALLVDVLGLTDLLTQHQLTALF